MFGQIVVLLCVLVYGELVFCKLPSLCGEESGWKLVFNEEFDGPSLDTSVWTAQTTAHVGHTNEMQYYTPDNAKVKDGFLVITTRKELYEKKNYTSAWVDSKGKFSARFGRVCIGAMLPPGKLGIWPAHWMEPDNFDCYAGRSEIDIMEMIDGNGQIHGSLHVNQSSVNISQHCSSELLTCTSTAMRVDFTEMHEYAVEWTSTALTYFVDAEPYLTCYASQNNASRLPQRSHYVILNTAVGGLWPHAPSPDTLFPQEHLIDYVKIAQHPSLNGDVYWNSNRNQQGDASPWRRVVGPRPPVPVPNV